MKATEYFMSSVLARRPYLKDEWIEFVLKHPIRKEIQENGRIRYWAFIAEIGNIFELSPRQMAKQFTMPFRIVDLNRRRQK